MLSKKNNVQNRKEFIEQIKIIDPLFDKLIEQKIAKCFENGKIKICSKTVFKLNLDNKRVEAPLIQGRSTKFCFRPQTSRTKLDFIQKSCSKSNRSKSTSIILNHHFT